MYYKPWYIKFWTKKEQFERNQNLTFMLIYFLVRPYTMYKLFFFAKENMKKNLPKVR